MCQVRSDRSMEEGTKYAYEAFNIDYGGEGASGTVTRGKKT